MDENLHKLKAAYRKGDRGALLRAVLWCLIPPEKTIPKWARIGLRDAIFNTLIGEQSRSWDEAFSRPHPKNKQLNPDRFEKNMEVLFGVEALQSTGAATDEGLFEAVAEKISKKRAKKISGSTVKSTHYKLKKDQKTD